MSGDLGRRGIDEDPLLSVAEAAARANMTSSAWRAGVSRGVFPAPDDPDPECATPQRRRPRWLRSTVDAFLAAPRPGQGRRTDLVMARKDRQRQLAEELAAPRPTPLPTMNAWLQSNHRALLAVAGHLVDHRDTLLNVVDSRSRDALADAIDQAGEAMGSRPTRLLATGVTYAQFLLRSAADMGSAPTDVREILAKHDRLHEEFNRLRDTESPRS